MAIKVLFGDGTQTDITLSENARRKVVLTFNPTGNRQIETVKTLAAGLISYLDYLGEGNIDPDVGRWLSMAKTDVETASMYGVKAAAHRVPATPPDLSPTPTKI